MAVNPAPISVLFLTDMLPVGGAETQLVALVNALDPERVRSRVVILRDHAELAPLVSVPYRVLKMAGPLDVRVIHRLRAIIDEHEIRAIHTTHVRSTLLARALRTFVRPAAPQRRLAVITTEHSYRQASATPILAWLRRCTTHLSDRIIAVSEAQATWLRATMAIPADRLVVIPNAIDLDSWADLPDPEQARRELGIRAEEPVFLCLARLAPVKEIGTMLMAMEHTPGHLILVGDGPERARLETLAQGEGLRGRVHIVGERIDPRPYLAAAWAICLSSSDECHPVALLEGMAAGRPAVATNVGGIPEIVDDGVTGILVPPRDHEALARAFGKVAQDASWRERAGATARRTVAERGSIQARARRIETLIADLVGGLCR